MVKWMKQKTETVAKPQRVKIQPNVEGNRAERRAAKKKENKPKQSKRNGNT